MKLDYQDELLRFLAQSSEAKRYTPFLEATLFSTSKNQIAFAIVKQYLEKYKATPSQAGILELFAQEAKKQNIATAVVKECEAAISSMFKPMTTTAVQLRETIVTNVQYQLTKQLMVEEADKLGEGVNVLHRIRSKMGKILEIGQTLTDKREAPKDGLFLANYTPARMFQLLEGMPTYLNKLNGMTAIGGFRKPQLILFMGGPKSFKTGTLLNVVMPYVREGKKVYYADFENSSDALKLRATQYMMEATVDQLREADDSQLERQVAGFYGNRGGDICIRSFQAYVTSMADIEADLDALEEETGWIPDIVAFDYLDLMAPNDKKISETRHKITAAYFDAKNMGARRNVLMFSLSQTNRAALSKPVLDLTDFGEDFRKAANCDAAFAICQTKAERKLGIARIVPVVQRQGIAYTGTPQDTCNIRICYDIQRVYELSYEEVLNLLDAATLAAFPELLPNDDTDLQDR